ncbi:MAG: L,D-transpeptidase, partial [Chloroflexi bacterium]|nr:L,D-transpeptidase [Chloroflexota bacterium]
ALSNASNIYVGQKLQVLGSGQVNPAPGTGAKLIEIDISKQRVFVWQGNTLVYNFVASTGQAGYGTRRGTFQIQDKIPMAVSGPLNLNMPNWMGIYWAGGTENGFHALPISRSTGSVLWGGYLGRPVSFGCIVLDNTESKLLYNFADVGTTVKIHD